MVFPLDVLVSRGIGGADESARNEEDGVEYICRGEAEIVASRK
jgi:hypothetical protein